MDHTSGYADAPLPNKRIEQDEPTSIVVAEQNAQVGTNMVEMVAYSHCLVARSVGVCCDREKHTRWLSWSSMHPL